MYLNQQPTESESQNNRPRYLQQGALIQELTGANETDILESAKKSYMADWLLNFVTIHFGEKESDILSQRKFRNFVNVRGVYSYFMHRKLKYSLPQIGRKLGNRDHTTILGAIKKIESKMLDQPTYRDELEKLWQNADKDFEDYVRKNNKQLNQQDLPQTDDRQPKETFDPRVPGENSRLDSDLQE